MNESFEKSLREKIDTSIDLSKGTRGLLQGRGEPLNTLETEGQMIQRVMPELMALKNILVLNDEAHHCYRQEAEKRNEEARLWISGLEAVNRKLGVTRVMDLSATPFFLRGSGYAEGTLFPCPRQRRRGWSDNWSPGRTNYRRSCRSGGSTNHRRM